jgi:sialic acid synthase
MKGTDQKGSSEPHEVKQLLHDIRTFEMSLGNYELAKDPSTNDSSKKLERSLATKRFIKQGEILTQNDIHMISPGNGFKWNDINLFLGKSALKDIDSNTILTQDLV